jgi:hypothetical protein
MKKVLAVAQEEEPEELPSGNDLYMALKSCNEIGSAKTLLQLMRDVAGFSK